MSPCIVLACSNIWLAWTLTQDWLPFGDFGLRQHSDSCKHGFYARVVVPLHQEEFSCWFLNPFSLKEKVSENLTIWIFLYLVYALALSRSKNKIMINLSLSFQDMFLQLIWTILRDILNSLIIKAWSIAQGRCHPQAKGHPVPFYQRPSLEACFLAILLVLIELPWFLQNFPPFLPTSMH